MQQRQQRDEFGLQKTRKLEVSEDIVGPLLASQPTNDIAP